jgi:enoyl-CoA hydratase/carnithine racemase
VNIRTEQDGRLRRVTLASPQTKNFLDARLGGALADELRDAAADDATGAILIDADGPIFCSGMDEAAGEELSGIGSRISKPIIAAVKGVALAGGLVLLANAHVVIAAQGTSFGLIAIREGKWSELVFRAMASAVGKRRALELGLTGRIFTTPDALAWGLVHMAAPAFELEDRATEVARGLANANADAVKAALQPR